MNDRFPNRVPPPLCAGHDVPQRVADTFLARRRLVAVWLRTLLGIGAAGLPLLCSLPVVLAQTPNPPAELSQANTKERLHTWWRDRAQVSGPTRWTIRRCR